MDGTTNFQFWRGGFGIQILEYDEDKESFFDSTKEKIELMQYTGLHDKNGREIFEGDIIIADWHDTTPTEIVLPGWYYTANEYYGAEDCKVIGNIYENPELIK